MYAQCICGMHELLRGSQQCACWGQPLCATRSTCYLQFVVHCMHCIYKELQPLQAAWSLLEARPLREPNLRASLSFCWTLITIKTSSSIWPSDPYHIGPGAPHMANAQEPSLLYIHYRRCAPVRSYVSHTHIAIHTPRRHASCMSIGALKHLWWTLFPIACPVIHRCPLQQLRNTGTKGRKVKTRHGIVPKLHSNAASSRPSWLRRISLT